MLFLFKEMKESVKKEVVPHPPILMHGGGGEGAGGTVHLLNRQPAHLATGNLKQIKSNLKVPFMYTSGINHFFRIFNPTFDE